MSRNLGLIQLSQDKNREIFHEWFIKFSNCQINLFLDLFFIHHFIFLQTAESYSEDSSQGCLAGICCNSTSGKRCCEDKGVTGANRASLNTSHRSGKYNIATGTYYTTSRTKQKSSQSQQNATPETCWSDLVYLCYATILDSYPII